MFKSLDSYYKNTGGFLFYFFMAHKCLGWQAFQREDSAQGQKAQPESLNQVFQGM